MRYMDKVMKNRYRVLQTLGHGAFSKVYLAEDILLSSRLVVLKVSLEERNEHSNKVFLREANVLSRVIHPNIVNLLDVGITEDGKEYLVTEYIVGKTLQEILSSNGRLQLSHALIITNAIAQGLSELHQAGLIHRDIKPDNIIVPQGPDGLLYRSSKLMDFGLAGSLEVNGNLTKAGQFFGTPTYMAPEQIRADRQSPTSDIYTLGVLLYEMIFGQLPFGGGSIQEVFLSKLEGQVRFPQVQDVPGELLSFIARCLSVNPENRPQSAYEVVKETLKLLDQLRKGGSYDLAITDKMLDVADNLAAESRFNKANIKRVLSLLGTLLSAGLATLIWLKWGAQLTILGIVTGVIYILCGIYLAHGIREWFKIRENKAQKELGRLLLSSKSRETLSSSIALEVDNLIATVHRIDDRILATSLAIMVKEYQESKESPYRQAALMNAVQLLEKLVVRLSPWYVRHEKLIALIVSLVGIISGVTAILSTIVGMLRDK